MSASADRHQAIVGKLARGSLLSRIAGHGRKPLRLTAVPRDHVEGDRVRGDALLAGQFTLGDESISLADLDFAGLEPGSALSDSIEGFSWLRDLAASSGRDRGARVAEALTGRW